MQSLLRWLALVLVAALALQSYFVGRIALMAVLDPQSTAFQRSEAWRLVSEAQPSGQSGRPPAAPGPGLRWHQQWAPYASIAEPLKRAVIASEDAGFMGHDGVEWDALEKAWQRNEATEARAARRAPAAANAARPPPAPRLVGGSTITQQLAKNLFLSGERTLLRKGQEFVLAILLEALLSKRRILEIYLNSVEWGEGVFGAEAAAQHYFRKSASRLSAGEAARLAVMLPRPKYFEKLPNLPYLASRTATIVARMGDAALP